MTTTTDDSSRKALAAKLDKMENKLADIENDHVEAYGLWGYKRINITKKDIFELSSLLDEARKALEAEDSSTTVLDVLYDEVEELPPTSTYWIEKTKVLKLIAEKKKEAESK